MPESGERFKRDVAQFDVAPLRFLRELGECLVWIAAVQRNEAPLAMSMSDGDTSACSS
jgi:hypothetical protein